MHEGRRFFLGGEKPYPVEELREQFSRQAELPPGGDPLIGSMFTIFNEQPPDSHIAKTNDMLATLRYENFPRTKPDEFANILRAAYSMYFLRDNKVLGKPNFDYAQVNTKQKLTEHLEHAAKRIFEDNDDDITVSLIQYYVSHAYLQTTVISRYAPGGVLLRTLDERYKGGADWLDDGASIGQGAYQLFNNAEHPLQFDVVSKRGDKKPYEQSDELLKQATNTLLLGSLPVARCVCLDIAQVHHPSKGEHGELDSGAVAWAEASLQPQEHMDTAFMKRFNELQHKASHRIDHKKLDISSKKDYEELLDVIGDRRFDMITAKTSLYPHPKYLVLKKLRRYIKLLKPDGFFYLQDSIHLPHGEEFHPVKKLQMKPDFHGAGSYTGTLYDRSLPKNGLQQVFTFRGTRAKEMVVNPKAVVMMNGEIVPLIDAIRLRAAEFSA